MAGRVKYVWKWASCKRRGEPKSKEQRREEGRGVSSGRGGLQVGDSESGGGQRRQEWGGVSGGASHGKTQQVHVYSRAGIYSTFNTSLYKADSLPPCLE